MLRDILVYANSFDSWGRGVTFAARLAAAERAALTAAFVYPTPAHMMPAYGSPALLAALVEQMRKVEHESLAAEQRFIAWAREQGVAKATWQVAEGYLPDALAHVGNWHDLLVLERNEEVPWESATDLGTLVLRAGLPCLVVPRGEHDPTRLDCIALAWNGAPEAVRAIHSAVPLLKRAGRVLLLCGHRRDALSEIGWRPPFDVQQYLGRHGINVVSLELTADDAAAGEALLDAAASNRADLLVMGAYGRNRFSEWVFGGATRHVLAQSTIPVLMRH